MDAASYVSAATDGNELPHVRSGGGPAARGAVGRRRPGRAVPGRPDRAVRAAGPARAPGGSYAVRLPAGGEGPATASGWTAPATPPRAPAGSGSRLRSAPASG